ncbi:MAG TPA: hypothetical protein VK466_07585 [Terriglobales bacterium]|nr:hypothetical protein [Terriglobales bacterium]
MALLESAGYACTRAAASLGMFDIIGISSKDVLLVQVKSNRQPPPHEMETLTNFKVPANCRKLVHIWVDYERMPRVKEL